MGFFYEFTWKALIAGVLSVVCSLAGMAGLAFFLFIYEPGKISEAWRERFWTEVDFSSSPHCRNDIEGWAKENCRGRWKRYQYDVYQFSRQSDAVLAKLQLG